MRMSRHMGIYASGSRKVTVSVYGAVSETVTITNGTDTYTVTTDANGVGTTTPEVKFGTYTVTGSVSAGALPSGRTVTVDRHTAVITAYPDGAIYWFGRQVVTLQQALYHQGSYSHAGFVTFNAGNVSMSLRVRGDSGYSSYAKIYADVTVAGYTTINIRASGSRSNGSASCGDQETSCSDGAQFGTAVSAIANYRNTLGAQTGLRRVGASIAAWTVGPVYCTADESVYAIWLE